MDIKSAEAMADRFIERGAAKLAKRREGVAFGKAAKHSRQFLGDCRLAGDMKLSRAIFMADWLGMTLDELMEEADLGDDKDADFLSPPRKRPEILDAVSRRGARVSTGNVEMSEELRRIDALRHENPILSLNELREALAAVAPEQLPFVLSIASSCYRMTFEFGSSALCVSEAQKLAKENVNDLAVGNSLQRWVYLLCDGGRYKSALARNLESRECYIAAGSPSRLGETIVDQSFCLHRMGEYKRALLCARTAKEFAGLLTVENNVTRMMTEAACHMSQGQIDRAREICQNALVIAKPHGNVLLTTKTIWVLGLIEGSAGNPAMAEKLILPTISEVMTHYPADAIVALLKLGVILLKNNLEDRCTAILSQLPEFIEEFRGIKPIEDAISDLAALALMRRVTVKAVEQALKRIHSGRAAFFYSRAA